MSHLLDRGTPDVTATDALDVVTACEIDLLAGRTERWTTPGPTTPHGVAARARVLAGEPDVARSILDDAPSVDAWSNRALASGAWAISRVGGPRLAAVDAALDRRGSSGAFLSEGEVPLGPVGLFVGLLAAASGDLERSVCCLRDAALVGDGRSPSWGARVRHELVRVLHDASADGDRAVAAECDAVRTTARMFYVSTGYAHERARLDAIGRREPHPSVTVAGCGVLLPGPTWTVGFGVQPPATVRRSKGLVAIHHLIRNRHRRMPAVELDAVLQPDAERRLACLEADIGRAVESSGEAGLRTLLHDDQIRSRVSKLIRRTVSRLGEQHRRLGDHLETMVETGHSCAYVGGEHVRWTTESVTR